MLLHRVITAIALAVPVIWIILFQPTQVLMYLLLVVAFLSGYEWSKLGGISSIFINIVFALAITAIPWLFITYIYEYAAWYISISVAWWLGVHIYLQNATPVEKGNVLSPAKLAVAFLVVPAAVLAMYKIHDSAQGGEWLLYGLALVWVADIGAYFSGRRFGKNKLAPKISPGKTREGLWGAMLATSAYSVVAAVYFGLEMKGVLLMLLLSLVLTVISVTGDLYESFLKREAGVKDSGTILPGHGGILDRIDSVLAAMPVFMLGVSLFSLNLAGA